MKLYVAGPMAGLPGLNYAAFRATAAELRAKGYEVVDPSCLNKAGTSWVECMKVDISAMLKCDGVALLQGWQESKGASLECQVASLLDMPCKMAKYWHPLVSDIGQQ